jgi:hypothetical protein
VNAVTAEVVDDDTTQHIGTARMVVHSINPSPGGRLQVKAYCKMLDPREPFVSATVTLVVFDGNQLGYHVGDEFDLTFGPALPS